MYVLHVSYDQLGAVYERLRLTSRVCMRKIDESRLKNRLDNHFLVAESLIHNACM